MSQYSAKPLSTPEFEKLRRRVVQNNDTLVDPQVVLRLIATVELLEGLRRLNCLMAQGSRS